MLSSYDCPFFYTSSGTGFFCHWRDSTPQDTEQCEPLFCPHMAVLMLLLQSRRILCENYVN